MLPKDSTCVRRSGLGTEVPGAIWHGRRVAAPSGSVLKEDAIELIKPGRGLRHDDAGKAWSQERSWPPVETGSVSSACLELLSSTDNS